MITKELVAYIRSELSRGIPRDTLARVLTSNGWDKKDVDEAFNFIKPAAPSSLPERRIEQPKLEPTAEKKIEIKPEIKQEVKPEIKVEPQKIEIKPIEQKKTIELQPPEIAKVNKIEIKKVEERKPLELKPEPPKIVEQKPAPINNIYPARVIPLEPKKDDKPTVGFSASDLATNPMLVASGINEIKPEVPKEDLKPTAPIVNQTTPTVTPTVEKMTPSVNGSGKAQMYGAQDSDFMKGKRKILKIALIIILLLGLGAGGVYAYQKYFANNPLRLLSKSPSSTQDIKSLKFKAQIQIEGNGKSPIAEATGLSVGERFQISLDGSIDGKDKEKPSAAISASVGAPVLFDNPVVFEARYTENILYLRIPKTDLLDLFIAKEAQPPADSWVSFSENDTEAVKNEMPDFGEKVSFIKTIPSQVLDAKGISKLKSRIIENKAVKDLSYKGLENIDEVETQKINFTVDNDGMAKVIETELAGITDEKVKNDLGESLKPIRFTDGSIWIGKGDNLIHKFAVTFYREDDPPAQAGDKNRTVTQLSITLSDFNKEISIVPPTPALSATEVLRSVEKSEGQVKTRELLGAAKLTAEVYARSHPSLKSICTNPQGFSDLINDLIHATMGLPKPTCRSDATSWVMYAPYGNSETYWCVDSGGKNEQVLVKPQKLACK